MKGGRWPTILALLVSLLLLGCFPSRGTGPRSDLESTVVAMQTEVAMHLRRCRLSSPRCLQAHSARPLMAL